MQAGVRVPGAVVMSAYDLAALATLALCLYLTRRAMQWADKPRGNWSSATYGEADATATDLGPNYSVLDVYDGLTHKP